MPGTDFFRAYSDGDGRVVVSGEIDVLTAAELRRVLQAAIDEAGPRVAVDLGGVEFIDAAGIGALADARAWAHRRGKRLVVQRPSTAVTRLLDLLGPRAGVDLA